MQYLTAGQTKVETFTVKSVDGTTRDVVVTITGTNDLPLISGDAVGAMTYGSAPEHARHVAPRKGRAIRPNAASLCRVWPPSAAETRI